MRSQGVLLILLIIFGCLVKDTQQFSFPTLELGKLEENLKNAGKKIIDKFTFVNWIVDRVKSMTNTKKDVTVMVSDAVEKYWQKKRFNDLQSSNVDQQQNQFTRHLQDQIDAFQNYLIKLYKIDTSDVDFIKHIKADPDRFFLGYDAYHLLKGLDLNNIESKTNNREQRQRNYDNEL